LRYLLPLQSIAVNGDQLSWARFLYSQPIFPWEHGLCQAFKCLLGKVWQNTDYKIITGWILPCHKTNSNKDIHELKLYWMEILWTLVVTMELDNVLIQLCLAPAGSDVNLRP